MTTGYKKGQETKSRILNAAYEAFSKYGYHGSSLREIAAACGISHPGIRHHFKSKEDLLIEMLRERDSKNYDDAFEQFEAEGYTVEVLVDVVRSGIATPGLVPLFTAMTAQAGDPTHPAHEYIVERYQKMLKCYTLFLTRWQKTVNPESTQDYQQVAMQVLALVDGIQMQWMMCPENTEIPQALASAIHKVMNQQEAINTQSALQLQDA